MLVTNVMYDPDSTFSIRIGGLATSEKEDDLLMALVQCLGGETSLSSLLAIIAEHEEREGPMEPPARPRIRVAMQIPGSPASTQQVVIGQDEKRRVHVFGYSIDLSAQVIP